MIAFDFFILIQFNKNCENLNRNRYFFKYIFIFKYSKQNYQLNDGLRKTSKHIWINHWQNQYLSVSSKT